MSASPLDFAPHAALPPAKPVRARTAAGGERRWLRLSARGIALTYLLLLLALPVLLVFVRTFEHGLDPVLTALQRPAFRSAFWLTILITLIAVPMNTVFGLIAAMALVRNRFRGRSLLNALIDLPFALSPVVVGLALILVYGKYGIFGSFLEAHGFRVIFAVPGMILATVFVSLPFVVREVMPVLREIGTQQEEAAATLGAGQMRTFWRVTLPSTRWGVIYGVILTTARCLGEFGAVSIVSGKLSGKTETLTLNVEERFQSFDLVGAYAASIVLALMAIGVLLAMNVYQSGRFRRRSKHDDLSPAPDQAVR